MASMFAHRRGWFNPPRHPRSPTPSSTPSTGSCPSARRSAVKHCLRKRARRPRYAPPSPCRAVTGTGPVGRPRIP